MLIALDSNVFIAALSPKEDHSPAAQQLVRDIAGAKHQAIASSIVYGEVIGLTKETQPQPRSSLYGTLLVQNIKLLLHQLFTEKLSD